MNVLRRFIREVLDGFAGSSPHNAPGNMRYDVAIRPGGSEDEEITPDHMNDDEKESFVEHTERPTKLASCVLIVADDGTILAVSRKDDPTALGMPGGKVDPGEIPVEAAVRELEEETGLRLTDPVEVFSMHDGDSLCYTFVGKVTGEISTPESGVIRWVEPHVLTDPNQSPFVDYNVALLTHMRLI